MSAATAVGRVGGREGAHFTSQGGKRVQEWGNFRGAQKTE